MVEYRADFLGDKEAVYGEMVRLCLDLGEAERGLAYAERAKSRALLALLAHRLDLSIQARDEVDRPLVAELNRLRAQRHRLFHRLEGAALLPAGPGAMDLEEGRRQLLALEKEIRGLWHRLLVRNADYARDAALWQVQTAPAQPYLDEDTLLLEYFTTGERLVAFLVTADAVSAHCLDTTLPVAQQWLQWLRLNLGAVQRTAPERRPALEANVRGVLARLYELLLAPLADRLAAYRRLLVVPHGPLHYVPFAALYDGRQYLLRQHEVSVLPGASFLGHYRQAGSAGTGTLAVGHDYHGFVPHAVAEAKKVAALAGGVCLLQEEATLAQVEAAAWRWPMAG
jgi:hypothetical protein